MCCLNSSYLANDIFMLWVKAPNPGEIVDGFFVLPLFDEVTRRFILEEREDEDKTGKYDMNACRDKLDKY